MNNIPSEIALAIVRNVPENDLPSLTLINRHFNRITNPLLWRTVDISSEQQLIKLVQSTFPPSQHGLLQYARSLTISYCLADATFLLLIPMLSPLLEKLKLSDAGFITDASFIYLPRQCPRLTSLHLVNAFISHQSMVSVGQCCSELRSITLTDGEQVSSNLFGALANCPLEEIHLNGLVLTNPGTSPMRTMALDLAADYSLLTSLRLESNDGHAFITTINSPWPHLSQCRLQESWNITDRDAIAFIRADPHLTVLELANNRFSDHVLHVVADTLSSLTWLNLSGGIEFTHHGVRRIIKQCPLLTFFDLNFTKVKQTEFPELKLLGHEYDAPHEYLVWADEMGALERNRIQVIRCGLAGHNNNNDNDDDDANVSNR